MFVKHISRRPDLTHTIRVGDGLVVLISDPGRNFAPGDEVHVILSDLHRSQIRVSIDAPREKAKIDFDTTREAPQDGESAGS